jgi:diacylglycerol kinase family enzyme
MIDRALLIINQSAATGHGDAAVERLRSALSGELGAQVRTEVRICGDHPSVAEHARQFLAESTSPGLIIAGGGGGTLRAVIEGVCAGTEPGRLPGVDRVRLAALRMGSGNVLAKRFGAPRDAEEGMRGIVAGVRSDATAPCCVMRVEFQPPKGNPEVRYAATLAGFGQFGRVPGDLARWHGRLPRLHKLFARMLSVERLTTVEYGASMLVRCALAALAPKRCEEIEIRAASGKIEKMRLMAGAVMNFDVRSLPFKSGVRAEDAALSLNFIPYRGRLASLGTIFAARRNARKALQIIIRSGEPVEIALTDRDAAEFFLDEDPLVFYKKLTVQVAGTLAFVPGPLYGR